MEEYLERIVPADPKAMRRADSVFFTGSPPLMVHFIAPLNALMRKRLIYRITDFHPECLIAERGRAGMILGLLLRLTRLWRRRVDEFEVLGFDQARRLAESGIPEGQVSFFIRAIGASLMTRRRSSRPTHNTFSNQKRRGSGFG